MVGERDDKLNGSVLVVVLWVLGLLSLITVGYGGRALIEVKTVPQRNVGFDRIAERIYRFPEVTSCYLLSGGYDLLLTVHGEDIQSIGNFVAEKLAPMPHVQGTVTHFLLKKYKEDGDVLIGRRKDRRLAITF